MIKETWKPVVGYEGYYEVSSAGDIRNIRTNHILKSKVENNGYVRVHLSKNGIATSELLHRVVAKAFLDNPDEHKTVNHIDENKKNNDVSNLEWCDMSYQNKYGNGAVRRNEAKERPVVQMTLDNDPVKVWGSITEASELLGLNPSTVVCVCKGKRRYKSTGGHKFKYVEECGNA